MKKAASICKILPPTLQTPIPLSSIAKIELRHPKHRSGFPSTRAFIKRYIPPMRYYNPSFLYKTVEVEGGLTSLVLFDSKDQEIKQLELKFTQTPEELLVLIQKIDKEIQEKAQNPKPARHISNDRFLSNFMRQTSRIKQTPLKINRVSPSPSPMKLKHLFSAESPNSTDMDHENEIGNYILKEIDETSICGFENGVVSRFDFQCFNIVELSCLVFSFMGLGFAILAYDIGFVEQTGFTETPITLQSMNMGSLHMLLLWLTVVSTLMLYPLVVVRYKLKIRWLKSKQLLSLKDSLFTTRDIYYIFVELFVYTLIPTPFYYNQAFLSYNQQEKVWTTYSYNELFSLLVLLRVFMVFRILLGNSTYYTNSAHRICQLTGCQNGYLFVIKCLMKSSPLKVLVTALLVSIMTFAYAVKVCERPLIYALSKKEHTLHPDNPIFPIVNDVSNYYNSLWLMMVTMTTVGYGDFFPRTTPGRAITFFACIFGVIVVSLMTLILMNFTDMNNSERRSYNIIEKLGVEREKRKHAGFVITNLSKLGFWKGVLIKKKGLGGVAVIIEKLKLHLKEFIRLHSSQDNIDLSKNIEEEISRHFTFLREDHKHLEENINKLCEKHLMMLEFLGIGDELIEPNPENNVNNSNNALNSSGEKNIYTPWLKRHKYRKVSMMDKVEEENKE